MTKSLRVRLLDAFQDGEALLNRVTTAVFRGPADQLFVRVRSAVLNEPPDIPLPPTWETGIRPPATVAELDRPTVSPLNRTIEEAKRWLMGEQHESGWWLGELGADTTLVSDYLFLMRFLGENDPVKERRLINRLLSQIQDDGGWNIYPEGPSEINITVKAYFALKLAGYSADHPILVRAREVILRLGGIPKCNSFMKILLAIFGQWSWDHVPAVVPELVLLPKWFYFNIYQISYWSRAILVPLSILHHYRPRVHVPPGQGLEEINILPEVPPKNAPWSWGAFFTGIDRVLRRYGRRPIKAIRRTALRKAHAWLREHSEGEGGVGAIYPAIMNAIMAFTCIGDPRDRELLRRQREAMRAFEVQEGETVRLQPCFSPVWDTAWAVTALSAAGVPPADPKLQKAHDWLLSKEVRQRGDWGIDNPWKEPGGWYFQFENEFYPDTDDTAAVLMALLTTSHPDPARRAASMERGVKWLLSMQCRNGGWGAFDRDNTKRVFEQVPFADHNALLDPPTEDVTARVSECLKRFGYDRDHPQVRHAIAFLESMQEADGSWYGRWGVNYIYGTWSVLRGLTTLGLTADRPSVARGAAWLKSVQLPDGGWGESCRTYDDPSLKGKGPATASQTAWAVMGLTAVCGPHDLAVRRGVAWLVRNQTPDGTWDEPQFTGGGFPKVFYLQYHLYRHYFPLLALGEFRKRGGTLDDIAID